MWLLKGSESAGDSPDNGAAGQETRANEDMKEQFEQQQVLLQQLKDLVRKNEQQLLKKEQDLEESASKLSKLKLQHKAKIVQLNNKLLETQKKISGPVTEKNPEDEQANETLSVDTSRGKVLMLKKQLEESRAIFEKRQKEMADKKHSVEEVLESLKIQLEEKDKMIAQLKSENPESEVSLASATKQDATGLQEMYAQIVYKDSKIMELDSRILQLERQVMDLQENVKEKEEVIQTRNKAIQLMTEDLGRRGKVVVDQLDDTRDQMRLMQENFAAMEADWRAKEVRLVSELDEAKIKFDRELSEKTEDISTLKTSLSKLESVRFELISRNAQLQEKVVRLQESFEKASKSSVDESASCLQTEMDLLKEELKKKDLIISDLQQSVGGTSKSNNQKLIKLKAQHKSQVRTLELQIKELKSNNENSEQVTALQNRIADLEEEKGNLQLRLVDFDEYLATSGQQRKQILELKENLARQSTDLDEHVKMISMVQGKHLDTIEQLAEKNRCIEDLEVALLEANTQLKNERDIKAHLEAEVNNLKTSHEAQRFSCEELLSKLETLKSEFEEERKTLSDNKKEKSSLELDNEKLRGTISELRCNLTVALDEKESKSELIEKFQEEVLEASRELQKEIEDLKAEKEHSNLLIQEKDAIIFQKNEEIGKMSTLTAQLTAELQIKSDDSNLLNETIAHLINELNISMDSHSLEGKSANEKIKLLIEQLGETGAEVNRLQSLCEMYDAKFRNTVIERDEALSELLKCNQIATERQIEFSDMEVQLDAIIKQRDDYQRTVKEKIIKLEELTGQLQNKEDQLNDALNVIVGLEDNLRQGVEDHLRQLNTAMENKQEEIDILQSKLQDKDEQCLKFQMEMQNAMDKCTTLEEAVTLSKESQEELEQTINELEKELKISKEKLVVAQSEMERLKGDLNVTRGALNDELVVKQDLEGKLEISVKHHESMKQEKQDEIDHLIQKLNHLQSEGGTHEAWVKTLETDLATLKSELQHSNQLIEELTAQISSCKTSEDKLLLENAELCQRCENISSTCADNAHALETVTQELKISKADLEDVSSCLQTVNSQLESRSSTISVLQMELKDVKDELVIMTSEKEAVLEENSNLNVQITAMEHKLKDLSPKLEKLNSLVTEFSSLQETFENFKENHETEISQLKSDINDLSQSLQEKELELIQKSQALEVTLEMQQREAEDHNVLEKALNSAQDQINIVMKERDDLRKSEERLQFFEAEFHKQVDNIGTLESEVKRLSEEDSRLRDQSARLMEYIQQLEADLTTTSEAAKELEAEQNIIYAHFREQLEKIQRVVHKINSPDIENEKFEFGIGVQDIIRDGSIFKSLLEDFDTLHTNVCNAFDSVDKQVVLSNENREKLQSELLILQQNYTLAVDEKRELEQQQLEFMDFKSQVETLTKNISELEQKFVDVNKINQTLEVELIKQNEESNSINEDNMKFKQELDVLQTTIQEQEKLIANIQSDYNDSQQQNASFQVHIQQMTDHVQSLQCNASEQVQSLSGQLELANKEVQALQLEISGLQNELQQQNLIMEQLKSSLEDFQSKYSSSQIQNEEYEMQIHQFTEKANISDKEVQSLQSEILNLQNELQQQDLTLEQLKSSFEDFQSKYNDSQIQNEEYQKQIQQFTEKSCNSDKEVQTLQSEILSLQNELQKQNLTKQQLKSSLDEFQSKYNNSQIKNEEYEMQIHQFTEKACISDNEVHSRQLEIESLTEQLSFLQKKLTDTENDYQVNTNLVQAHSSEIEDLQHRLKTANENLADFEVLVSDINQEILHEKGNNEKLKEDLEKMHKEAQLTVKAQYAEDEWQSRIRETEVKIQELQNQIFIISSNLEEAVKIKDQLQIESQEKNKQCDDMRLCLEQKAADVNTANEMLSVFNTIVLQIKSSLFPVVAENTNLLDKNDIRPSHDIHDSETLAMSFEDSCAMLIKVQEKLQENNAKINTLESARTSLRESLLANTAKISELESANERLREEADQLKEQHLFLQTQLSQSFEADTTVDMLKSQLEYSTDEKQAMQESFKEQENVIGALLDQRRHLEERLNEAQNKVASDAMEIERMLIDNSRLEEKLVVESNARVALQNEIDELNNQFQSSSELKSKVEEIENLNRVLNEEKHVLEDKLNSWNIQNEEKQSSLQIEIEELKKDVSVLQETKGRYKEELRASLEEIRKLGEEKCKYESLANESVAEHHHFEDLKSEHQRLKLFNEELKDKLHVFEMRFGNQWKNSENKEDIVNHEKQHVIEPSIATDHLLGASPDEHTNASPNYQASPDITPENKQLKTQLAVLQIKNEKMLSKLKLFKDKNDKLQLQINNLLTTQGLLEDDKVRLGHYNEHAKDEIGRLSSELRNVERLWKSEVKMLQDRLDTVEVANSKIVEIKEDIERKLMKQIDHCESIMNEKVEVERSLSEALAKLNLQESTHKENIDQLTLQQTQLVRQLDSLQKHETFMESDNAEFQRLIEKLRSEKTKSDQEIKVQSEKYVLLVQDHNKLIAELEDLHAQLEDVGDVSSLKENYTSLQKDYKELVNVKLHLEAEAENLKSELNAAVNGKALLEMEINSAKALLCVTPALHETDSDLKAEKLVTERSDLCLTIQQLTKELLEVKFENEEFKNKAHLSQLDNVQNQNISNNCVQSDVEELKSQNKELLEKIACLEGDIWKLEDEKQQLIDLGNFSEQKSLNKALTDVNKLQAENKKLIEELDNQDVDLKQLETAKNQIEEEARLTFQKQQETITTLRNQILQQGDKSVEQHDEVNSTELQKLNIELSNLKEKFRENVLLVESENKRSTSLELKNCELRNEIEDLQSDLRQCKKEKHVLNNELTNLKGDSISVNKQLDQLKMQYSASAENRNVSNETLLRQSSNVSIDQRSESSALDDIHLLKSQVEKLSSELQHTMHSLHAKDLRCEQLTSEIAQLIEERDSLQMRLASLLRADQQKEMKMKLLEKQLLVHPTSPSALSDGVRSNEEQGNFKASSGSIDRRLRECEEQRRELQQINAVLDQALAAEREHRIKITADLKFANEELAGLGRRPKLKQETILKVDEDDDGQVPLLPEHSQILERSYMRTSWRISNWIQGRSTPRILHV